MMKIDKIFMTRKKSISMASMSLSRSKNKTQPSSPTYNQRSSIQLSTSSGISRFTSAGRIDIVTSPASKRGTIIPGPRDLDYIFPSTFPFISIFTLYQQISLYSQTSPSLRLSATLDIQVSERHSIPLNLLTSGIRNCSLASGPDLSQ